MSDVRKQKQTHRYREHTTGYQQEERGVRARQGKRTKKCKLLGIKQQRYKDMMFSTGIIASIFICNIINLHISKYIIFYVFTFILHSSYSLIIQIFKLISTTYLSLFWVSANFSNLLWYGNSSIQQVVDISCCSLIFFFFFGILFALLEGSSLTVRRFIHAFTYKARATYCL